MSNRQVALVTWLQQTCHFAEPNLARLAGDASFRSYFRLHDGDRSYIVMDAPPPRENCQPFVAIANALRPIGVTTPEIIASDIEQGFLLLSDFGDRLYLKELNNQTVKHLYPTALTALSVLQSCANVPGWNIPLFTVEFMRQEMEWFKQWCLAGYLNLTDHDVNASNDFFDWLTQAAGQQPYVFMHRDYHSANLMRLSDEKIGVLDFQDAFRGPVTYDLASLLRDCYIAWPDEWVINFALSYLKQLQDKNQLKQTSQDEFLYWFDVMSMQRHLKALMTFSRKYVRDHDANYLKHIPRTLNYLISIGERYKEAKMFHRFLTNTIQPAFATKEAVCAR